ncbi:hypothetical protein CHUAL_002149 [Chamberlinius hualienensis]
MTVHTFEVWDYVSMVGMVILSTAIAFYHVFKVKKDTNKSTKEFLVTGKDVGFFPIVLSTVASCLSPVSVQGYPHEIYAHGVMFSIFIFTPYLSMYIFTQIILPVFYNLGISSVFEYLEYRFHRSVRLLASIVSVCQMTLYTSCVVYSPALAISQVTGFHLWGSVLTIGITCIIYTTFGGIKAVIWADAVQFLVMIGVTLTVIIKGAIDVGGMSVIFNRAYDGFRLNFFLTEHEYSSDTVFTYVIGGVVLYLVFVTPNQMFVQRLLANPTIKSARWSLFVSSFIMSFFMLLICLLGFIMYAKYHTCDPKSINLIETGDQLVPLFALETLGIVKGLTGIFVSGILCASLSTLSSVLNALATVTLMDYIVPFRPNMSEKKTLVLSKVLSAAYGVLCIALVSVVENLGGVIRAIFALSGAIGGPLLGVFTLGIFFPWATYKGALAGFITSLAVCFWATVGNMLYISDMRHLPISTTGCNITLLNSTFEFDHQITINNSLESPEIKEIIQYPLTREFLFYEMSPIWYGPIALAITYVVGIAVSIVTGSQDPEELDPSVVAPIIERFFRKLPLRYRLFFGYKSEKSKYTKCSKEFEHKNGTVDLTSSIEMAEKQAMMDENNEKQLTE